MVYFVYSHVGQRWFTFVPAANPPATTSSKAVFTKAGTAFSFIAL